MTKAAISLLLACVLVLASLQVHAEIMMPPIKNRHLLSGVNYGKYTTAASTNEGTSGDHDNTHHVYGGAEKPHK